MLFADGRLRAPGTVESSVRSVVENTGVIVLEISSEIAALSTMFPQAFPQDPADRLIAATAHSLGLSLVTRDQRILDSGLLKTIWWSETAQPLTFSSVHLRLTLLLSVVILLV